MKSSRRKIFISIFLALTPFVLFAQNKKGEKIPEGMVLIPAGEFWMGSNEDDINTICAENKKKGYVCSKSTYEDEAPKHKVYLDTFFMDIYEITNAQYSKCVDAGKCEKHRFTKWHNDPNKAKHSVAFISWFMAEDYCEWLGKRLPTEAQWEKAARGEMGNIWPWGNTFGCENSCNSISPCFMESTCSVGSFPKDVSPYGIFDMAGNVWEWVSDWYDIGYYKNSPEKNPQGPKSGEFRVLRGGSWLDIVVPDTLRGTSRRYAEPKYSLGNFGFRCAKDAE